MSFFSKIGKSIRKGIKKTRNLGRKGLKLIHKGINKADPIYKEVQPYLDVIPGGEAVQKAVEKGGKVLAAAEKAQEDLERLDRASAGDINSAKELFDQARNNKLTRKVAKKTESAWDGLDPKIQRYLKRKTFGRGPGFSGFS